MRIYFPQCILLENTFWSYSTTHFDWSLISGQLYIAFTTVLQNIHFFAGHGADASEGADSVAWDGGVSLMAGLSLCSLETSLRPR